MAYSDLVAETAKNSNNNTWKPPTTINPKSWCNQFRSAANPQAQSGKTGMPGKMDVPPKSPLAARSQTQTGIQNSQTTKRKMGSRMVMARDVG